MTNFDRIAQARKNSAYDYLRARNSLLAKIKYNRELHPLSSRADEAALYIIRQTVEQDIDRLLLNGYKGYVGFAAESLFIDSYYQSPQEKAAYAVSVYDVMKDYNDIDLIHLFEISLTNWAKKCAQYMPLN